MAVTFTTQPQYAAAGRDTFVAFSVTGTGNFLRGFFTDAPIGSEVKTQLLNSGSARVPAFDSDTDKTWTFRPDVGGVYSFQVEQYQKGTSNYGGGYQDSPDGFRTETLTETSNTTLSVGQKLTQRIGFGGDTATLTLFVVGDVIRATTFDQYGFTSPLISDAKTPKALTASLNPGVIAAAATLVGMASATALQNPPGILDNIVAAFNAHIVDATYHPTPDTDNGASAAYLSAESPEGLKRAVTQLLKLLDQHMRGDDGGTTTSTGGTGTRPYHVSSQTDWLNAALATNAGDTLDTFVALCDLWRAYDGHVRNAVVHSAPGPAHTPSPLFGLPKLHVLFLAQLSTPTPTAPPSVNAAVTALIHGAGFEEA